MIDIDQDLWCNIGSPTSSSFSLGDHRFVYQRTHGRAVGNRSSGMRGVAPALTKSFYQTDVAASKPRAPHPHRQPACGSSRHLRRSQPVQGKSLVWSGPPRHISVDAHVCSAGNQADQRVTHLDEVDVLFNKLVIHGFVYIYALWK